MPDGLLYTLSAKLSSDGSPRVSVISCEGAASYYIQEYVQTALNNCLEMTEGRKPHIHFIPWAGDFKSYDVPESRFHDLTVYKYESGLTLASLYENFRRNVTSRPEQSHLMIIDNYSVFSVLTASRNVELISDCLRKFSRYLKKLFIFFGQSTVSTEEISVVYNLSTDMAYLHEPSEDTAKTFVCDLLKFRHDRRLTYDRTVFQLTNDGIKEDVVRESNSKDGNDSTELLKNLTTFKLTLEDGERESKNQLHLPYFEAQKTALEDPENYDDYDDEEDEEV